MSDSIDMRVRAATRSSLGRTPSAEMMWPRKSTRAAPIRDLSEGALVGEGAGARKRQLMSLRDEGDSRPCRLHRQDTCGYYQGRP